ncbi:D-glycero-beta-D-manno-heptose-1,7-bisphosphate 7-phosphatase [Snodgrassella alvi]|uniref:D,D-heptose 1,7-bisphosphate phosphatase n=1 Tax=Snodgrassella alvi TaxID=1196083 RepID=A0A2N9WUX8_9NEIS|nr:D-glycero-beta-D-manno-heptose 1,7-bisphosphate 7-phosphatase [Snodgrassella alvi]PIT16641.1 D-glycero-beta-D-manno-heptose-1,7-bisphosphate 7-phosphatase [Snodgrassella alvi]
MALSGKGKLIILDRDGVLNAMQPQPISDPDQWLPLPGSMDAVAFLTQSGYTVVVAENMSGIGRDQVSMQELNEVHGKMHTHIQKAGGRLSGVWFCPHTNNAKCNCRKPQPGLLLDILDRLHMKAENTWLVGDGIRDMQAIAAIGGHPVLVLTGKGKETLKMETLPDDTQVYDDLLDFAKFCRTQAEKAAEE